MASLKEKIRNKLLPNPLLEELVAQTRQLVLEQYEILNQELLPALKSEQIQLKNKSDWNPKQRAWLKSFFQTQLLPVLSPIGLDPAHPFPLLANKSLNFIVSLKGQDAFGRRLEMAVVPAPKSLPRLVQIGGEGKEIVSLEQMIRAHMSALFPHLKVVNSYQFRVTRNSNLSVDEEEADDLLQSLEGELTSRRYGNAVRLEIEESCPDRLVQFLSNHFELQEEDIYRIKGPVNLVRLTALYDWVDRPDLKFPALIAQPVSITFQSLKKADRALLHPFESFASVCDFLKQAARDPHVLVIKQTLYRTGSDSVIVDHLVEAANAGKEVTVVIELRARFDEEANIQLASRLQEAGAHVVYGIVGYKTHAKMLLVVRREKGRLRRYVHLGTGNYHPKTGKLYVDYSFFTTHAQICEDVHQIFLQLTGLSKRGPLQKCLEAPFSLKSGLLEKIERERINAKNGLKAGIKAKLNALADHDMMHALHHAAEAGVSIELTVRGICCLKPGPNLKIYSVLGRFLEHSRVFYFENNGQSELFLSSADWMSRNLVQRVEIAWPIESPELKARILKETFEIYLEESRFRFELQEDGTYIASDLIKGSTGAQNRLLDAYRALVAPVSEPEQLHQGALGIRPQFCQ